MNDKETIVKRFAEECVWARSVRDQFHILYESGKRRRELLSEVANIFFSDLNVILQEYIILQMCKLTDPAQFGRNSNNKNLSTNQILSLNWDISVGKTLEEENNKMEKFRGKIVDARSKAIAHADLETYAGNLTLGGFEKLEETEFWEALQRFVNAAHISTFGEPYEIESVASGDAESLIYTLKEAMDYNDLVETEEGFLSGRFGKMRYEDA